MTITSYHTQVNNLRKSAKSADNKHIYYRLLQLTICHALFYTLAAEAPGIPINPLPQPMVRGYQIGGMTPSAYRYKMRMMNEANRLSLPDPTVYLTNPMLLFHLIRIRLVSGWRGRS